MKNILILLILLFTVSIIAQKNGDVVPNSFVVIVKQDKDLKKNYDKGKGRNKKLLASSIHGYLARMTTEELKDTKLNPEIDYVEQDRYVFASENTSLWNLDRIDQRGYPLDGVFSANSTGSGVSIYVIDSGINFTHQDFEGRATLGADFVGDGQNGNDCYGHGTHVAGLAGSTTYGVAKKASLYSVRIADCSGQTTVGGIIQAIDWISINHKKPAVANLSYTLSGISNSLNTAIRTSINYGVSYVVSSGNFNSDACAYSPSSVQEAMTVGSMVYTVDNTDYRMSYSNYGTCVDIMAPGQAMLSTYIGSDIATTNMNGTSMASPMVAGSVALHLAIRPLDSPSMAYTSLVDNATKDVVTNVPVGTPNNLLYVNYPLTPTGTYPVCTFNKMNNLVGLLEDKEIINFSAVNGQILTASITPQNGLSALVGLEQLKGSSWQNVGSEGLSVTNTVRKGTYRWKVRSISGSGGFNFCYN